ncbi:MAG: hypothetical protein EPO40_27955 [Myxococcaceae bacterium]|nr:MAG: hypothetical protein EPO40_27955 [Myxococcaceae bacterium]
MAQRKVEIFSAGCGLCSEAVEAVRAAACPGCGVEVRDMSDPAVAADAKRYGVTSVPAVVIDGVLANCCKQGAIDLDELRRMGLGRA